MDRTQALKAHAQSLEPTPSMLDMDLDLSAPVPELDRHPRTTAWSSSLSDLGRAGRWYGVAAPLDEDSTQNMGLRTERHGIDEAPHDQGRVAIR